VRSRAEIVIGFAVVLAALTSAAAAFADPALDVPAAKLRAALHCQRQVTHAKHEPVLLLSGTGVEGSDTWPDGLQPVLSRAGHPSCYVNLPEHTTADMQISVQYVVYAVRQMNARAGRPIAMYGLSQGALLARMALTYLTGPRSSVTDAVLLAGPQHGSALSFGNCPKDGCAASVWQRIVGSHLLTALNKNSETPGPTSYTTVRSLNDTTVTPVDGPHPTSALAGASNLVVQPVCPGRVVEHVALSEDTVAYAALLDAMAHPGPARQARFPARVCARPFAEPGDSAVVRAHILKVRSIGITNVFVTARKLKAEPPLRGYVRHPHTR